MVEGVDVGLLIDRLPYRPLGIETAAQHVVSAIQDAVIRHTTDPWPFKRVGRHSSDAIPYPNPEVVDDSLLLRFDNCLQVRPIDLAALPGYDEYRDSHPPLPPDVATG
ncbi:MAG: hypothetical protein QOJ29_351 [Thermoleophilaceae bacterium]|nr:hypothetical protein [Thermoleophilaceae bacterium]